MTGVSDQMLTDPLNLAILFVGLMLAGVLKGAAGAGVAIIAIPVVASVYDIRVAVVLMVLPNFFTNLWQIIGYWKHNTEPAITYKFAACGAIGAGLGTALLAVLPISALGFLAASMVLIYVALRLAKGNFRIPVAVAHKWVYVVGTFAGSLQGAMGLSAPVSITFMHSMQLGRDTFIFAMSVFFAMMSVMQFPVQIGLGLTSVKFSLFSMLAMIPILIGLPIGSWIGRRMNAATFDKTILCLLIVLALKMINDSLAAL